jgi:hypothetical protein
MAISKKKIFLGIPVALISFELYFGVLFGYLFAKFFSGRQTGQRAKFGSLRLEIGNLRFHLHHWLYGLAVLASSAIFNFSFPWPQFSLGLLAGFIVQGIISYSDWYKIFQKII